MHHFLSFYYLDQIEKVLQSHSELGLQSDIVLNVITIPDPLGGPTGSKYKKLNPRKFHRLEDYLKRKYGILDPSDFQHEENICLPLCIAFYIGALQKTPRRLERLKEKIKGQKKLPESFISTIKTVYTVLKLNYNSKIELSAEVFNQIQDWLGEKFQSRLKVYRFYTDMADAGVVYSGNSDYIPMISLLIYQSHCYLITSESTFFGKKTKEVLPTLPRNS